jgi:hypothetical protein
MRGGGWYHNSVKTTIFNNSVNSLHVANEGFGFIQEDFVLVMKNDYNLH